MSFWSWYLGAFGRPRRAMEAALARPERLRLGALAVLVTAVLYGLVYFFLARNGGRPTVFHPWLAIPAEEYYRWDQWLIVPSLVLAWISATGFAHLAARALGGSGTFDDTFVVLGLGLSISSWWTGLHDVVTTFLGFVGVIDQRAYEDAMSGPTPFRTALWILMTGYLVWFLVTFTKGIRAAHRLRTGRAALAGSIGVAVYNLVFVIFNR